MLIFVIKSTLIEVHVILVLENKLMRTISIQTQWLDMVSMKCYFGCF
jgi:hypothetical protein